MRPSLGALLLDWHWRADVLVTVAMLAGTYVTGWRRLRARGGPARRLASGLRLGSYLGGLGAILLALCSALEPLAEVLFTAHMIQHQLLLMAAPPLLLLGEPYPIVLWGLPPRLRRALSVGFTRGGSLRALWRALTWMPVAGLLFTLNLWGWHHPAAYEAALARESVHDLEHLAFFSTAVLFWWPVVNPAPRLHRLRRPLQYGLRIGYLVLATALNTLLGAVLGLAERVLYPTYAAAPRLFELSPLDDQALGGGIMWSGSHMYLIGVLALVAQVLDSEEGRGPAAVGVPPEG